MRRKPQTQGAHECHAAAAAHLPRTLHPFRIE
jgi:hypothetical protein